MTNTSQQSVVLTTDLEVCERCGGSGVINVRYGGDGYGGRCCAEADGEGPCPDCQNDEDFDPYGAAGESPFSLPGGGRSL